MTNYRRTPVFWICVLLALGARAAAQSGPDNDPDGAPGYAKSVFDHGQLDSINLYNGQLTVPLPLGPAYPIGPKLKLQLVLTYNSQVDNYGEAAGTEPGLHLQAAGRQSVAGHRLGAHARGDQGLPARQSHVRGLLLRADGSQHMFNKPQANGSITGDASPLLPEGLGPLRHVGRRREPLRVRHRRPRHRLRRGRDRLCEGPERLVPHAAHRPVRQLLLGVLLDQHQPAVDVLATAPVPVQSRRGAAPEDAAHQRHRDELDSQGHHPALGPEDPRQHRRQRLHRIDDPLGRLPRFRQRRPDHQDLGLRLRGAGALREGLRRRNHAAREPAGALGGQPAGGPGGIAGLPIRVQEGPADRDHPSHVGLDRILLRAVPLPPRPGRRHAPRLPAADAAGGRARAGLAGEFCGTSAVEPEAPFVPPGECTEDNPIRWVDTQWGVTRRTETVGTATNVTDYSQIAMPRGESRRGAADPHDRQVSHRPTRTARATPDASAPRPSSSAAARA